MAVSCLRKDTKGTRDLHTRRSTSPEFHGCLKSHRTGAWRSFWSKTHSSSLEGFSFQMFLVAWRMSSFSRQWFWVLILWFIAGVHELRFEILWNFYKLLIMLETTSGGRAHFFAGPMIVSSRNLAILVTWATLDITDLLEQMKISPIQLCCFAGRGAKLCKAPFRLRLILSASLSPGWKHQMSPMMLQGCDLTLQDFLVRAAFRCWKYWSVWSLQGRGHQLGSDSQGVFATSKVFRLDFSQRMAISVSA